MRARRIPVLAWTLLALLVAATVYAGISGHWSNVFVVAVALALSLLPGVFERRFNIRLPVSFVVAISLFTFATLFLGEILNFYERFWWWDLLLHGVSAIGFGIIGFLFVFYLFQGDRYAAPPWALGFIAFCFALALGTVWEIFEFGMDQIFGLNMQKSGLVDTMTDLIVDVLGATIGGVSGFFWLKERQIGFAGMIEEFVTLNRSAFRKLKAKAGARLSPRPRGRE